MWLPKALVIHLWTVFLFTWAQPKRAQDFIKTAEKVSLLVIHTDYCPDDWLQQILEQHPKPIVLRSLRSVESAHVLFPRDPLHLVCLPGTKFQSELLEPFSTALNYRRQEKILFYLTGTVNRSTIFALLRHCFEMKMLNVLVFNELNADDEYYSYNAFPHFLPEQHSLEHGASFSQSFPNMQGHPLIILPDQRHPRSIVYRDRKTGKLLLTGSVGRLMNTLAWKLNATLTYPFPLKPGNMLHSTEMAVLTKKLSVDIPAGAIVFTNAEQLNQGTYPFELTTICLMIPLAQELPLQDIYLMLSSSTNIIIIVPIIYAYGVLLSLHKHLIGKQRVYLADFLLNDAALRGLLGQSFRLALKSSLCLSLIYFTLGTMGLNLSCIYQAMLGTMLTHPLKQPQPRTFEQLREAQLPLLIGTQDTYFATGINLQVETVSDNELQRARDTMNTSYVYLTSRLHWGVFDTQQRYFQRPLFLYSMDACFNELCMLSFIMPNNSWFIEPINKLNLEVRENGIYQHWVGLHVFDMAAAGLLHFQDQSPVKHYGVSIRVIDLQWIWYTLTVLLFVACLIFGVECTCCRRATKRVIPPNSRVVKSMQL